ncbi:MAG: hypothetical protein JNJ60_03605 [Rhodocyclaceae bacterium]|nr:hypothetical protein [Rhodocyclaceae bacterium]
MHVPDDFEFASIEMFDKVADTYLDRLNEILCGEPDPGSSAEDDVFVPWSHMLRVPLSERSVR